MEWEENMEPTKVLELIRSLPSQVREKVFSNAGTDVEDVSPRVHSTGELSSW